MCFNYFKYSHDSATLVRVFTVSNVSVSVFLFVTIVNLIVQLLA